MLQKDVKISCFIEYDSENDEYCIYTNLTDDQLSMTLEFADITSSIYDLFYINESYNIYIDEEELLDDIEEGYFNRFLGRPYDNERLDLLLNLQMKMKHRAGICDDSCILCNPDLGTDPFPDFTFNLRVRETEGEG